jgi:hypothetical protein
LNGILTFLKVPCTCGLEELVAWHLVVRRELRLILGKEEVLGSIPVGGVDTMMCRWKI